MEMMGIILRKILTMSQLKLAVYAQLHGKDAAYTVETVAISTFLSIITLPILAGLAAML